MRILVDADACPVKEIILQLAKQYQKTVLMVCDTAHLLSYPKDSHVSIKVVDKGMDRADFALANLANTGDIWITSDYGLAALFLSKGAVPIHPNGFFYTNAEIDRMLFTRHISRELRKQKRRYPGHIKKRTAKQDMQFIQALTTALTASKQSSPESNEEKTVLR